MMMFLGLFIINLQYMSKTCMRYQVKVFNHSGDFIALIGIIVAALFLSITKKVYYAGQLGGGPPVVNFHRIIPKGNKVFDYYSLEQDKPKKESNILEL